MKKNSFIQGAVILAVSGIIVKLIGAVSRIYLSRLLGGEGIGLYQMAYPIYLLCLSISTAGLPVAISIMVSERNAIHDFLGGQRILKIALSVLTLTGLLFSVGLYFGSSVLIDHHIVRDPRAYWSLIALAPAVFCATISATMRGYFQGLQNMTPTAVSEVIEQFVRVVTMIGLAIILLPKGLEFGAAGATFGAAPGAAAAILTLGWFYWHDRKHRKMWYMSQDKSIVPDSTWNIMKRLFILAIPVSCANIMIPIVSNIDLFIVPKRLEVAGFNVEQATTLFGYLTGMATALINMPTIVTSSMSSSLVPGISEASIKRDFETIRRRARTALRLASVFTLPAAIGLGVIATPISTMLYATPNAGPCIAVMSIGIFFLGIQQVTTGILQGLGKTAVPFINLIVSGCVKVAFSWGATVLAAVVISFPLMYRAARGAFEQVNPDVLSAGRTIGMSEWKIFWKVQLPIAWPGVVSGAVLAFARGLGEFGATAMIAGNIKGKTRTLPLAVYSAVASGNMKEAGECVAVLVCISFIVVICMNYFSMEKKG